IPLPRREGSAGLCFSEIDAVCAALEPAAAQLHKNLTRLLGGPPLYRMLQPCSQNLLNIAISLALRQISRPKNKPPGTLKINNPDCFVVKTLKKKTKSGMAKKAVGWLTMIKNRKSYFVNRKSLEVVPKALLAQVLDGSDQQLLVVVAEGNE